MSRRKRKPAAPPETRGEAEPAPPPPVAPDADAEPAREDAELSERIDTVTDRLITKTTAEVNGLFQILGSKRRLFTINFLAGLSRGIGFFLGVTLLGGLVIGGLAIAFDFTARAVGLKDLTFRRMIQVFAEKAIEAESVWEDVRAERGQPPVAEPAADPTTPDEPPAEQGEPHEDAAPTGEPR